MRSMGLDMMELLLRWWPLIKVALVFVAMLAGIRRLGVGFSILGGGLLLSLLFGKSFVWWFETSAKALVMPQTLFLAAIVGLILVLSDLLDRSGQASRLMEALRGRLRKPRLRLVFFPSLIGLLPMPGGAVFSAPMLKTVAEGLNVPPRELVMLNYWFRHVWEMCWPLYPGIILAASLAGVPVMTLLEHTWPGTVVALALGWIFFLRPAALPLDAEAVLATGTNGSAERPGFVRLLWLSMPLAIAIVGSLGLEAFIAMLWPTAPSENGILIGLAAAIVAAALQNRWGAKAVLGLLWQKHLGQMLFIVATIFVFKECLSLAGVSEALTRIAGGQAALLAASTLLPAVMGVISGLTIAFVGASLPMILGILEMLGRQDQAMGWITLAMFSGFSGIMASPLHICFLLTCQFFEVDMATAWKRVFPAAVALFLFGAAYVWGLLL